MSAPPRLRAERTREDAGSGVDPLREEPGPGAALCLRLYAKLAAGVTVVTARGEDGPLGMTVSSVTSLSARPPLLLACLRDGSRTLAAIRAYGVFAVHLLREDQHDLATRFAHPTTPAPRRFAGTPVRQVLGVPVLDGALAWSVCLVEDIRRYGDHCLVVGRVAAVQVGGGRPLLWHDRGFKTLAEPHPGPVAAPVPGPAAVPDSVAAPVPGPAAVPDSVAAPVPGPAAAPDSVPVPDSVPGPVTDPVPGCVPVQELVPELVAGPAHAPAPVPGCVPAPDPAHAPAPVPAPDPAPDPVPAPDGPG
ncbi:flavin reductase (DIM6/NTAB) family NADH-FMN oxidoreductase RutF [Streptomyces sp. LBL]|nr:flavin reductase (DIM6/NTAB) family NADH-FMN oxidoreductase RutF [Streptomyces sp. LBL]